MASASETLHEDPARLKPETIERHRAIVSLQEELEAADWYDQRVDATQDEELRAILAHHRDEEKEHASMLLEWLRRHDSVWDRHLRDYLFSEGSITGREEALESGGNHALSDEGSLRIGSLRQGGKA